MADMAFLLLIFFLVATNFLQDRGLTMQLPPPVEKTKIELKDRNVFKILINSRNQFLIENEIRSDISGLADELVQFITNPSADASMSESPDKAIISVKAQRGTEYANFIHALDEAKEAYYRIYGDRVGLSSTEFRKLDLNKPRDRALYQKARAGLPMAISIANPD